jgi:hypothetical protein
MRLPGTDSTEFRFLPPSATAGRAVPERLGFQLEGIIRDAEWLYDHFVDHAMYAILKKDWNGEQQGGEDSPPAALSLNPTP